MSKLKRISENAIYKNFLYLNLTQVINYIFPFITFPYISRVLSPEVYGVILSASAFASYIGLLSDFGFNLSATRDIAKAKGDNSKINSILNQVLSVKLILYSFFLVVASLVIILLPKYSAHAWIYLGSFIGVLGGVIFPTWYFQACNKMQTITLLNLVSRSIVVILLLLLVHNDQDAVIFIGLNSATAIFVGGLSWYLIVTQDRMKLRLVFSLRGFILALKLGFASFTAVLLVSFYTTFNSVLLSWFCTFKDVAIYGVADKIIGLTLTFQGALIQAVYPSITAEDDKILIQQKLRKLFKVNLLFGCCCCLGLNLLAPVLIHVLVGQRYDFSIAVLRVLSVVPIIMACSSTLSTYCFALRKERFQAYAYVCGVSYCLVANFIFIKKYSYMAVSYNFIICEVLSLSVLYFWLRRSAKSPRLSIS